MTTASTAWVMANWTRLAGLPTPDASPWMLRDTPLTRSTLECLKSYSLVERAGREKVAATATRPATAQMTYRTKRHNSVFDPIDKYTDLPRETAEAFAADPTADVYAVELFAGPDATVAGDVERVTAEFDLDVQLIGVGTTEPAGYPGRFVEATHEELLDASSPVLRAVPCTPDVLVAHPQITFNSVARTVIGRTDPRAVLMNPADGMLDDRVEAFLLDDEDAHDVPRSARRERPDDGQRMLSHFDPNVVVDDEVTFAADGGDADPAGDGEGQATLDALF